MGRKDRPQLIWASTLESIVYDLQELLDELDAGMDDWTVGEVRRVRELVASVREGALAVEQKATLNRVLATRPVVSTGIVWTPSSQSTWTNASSS